MVLAVTALQIVASALLIVGGLIQGGENGDMAGAFRGCRTAGGGAAAATPHLRRGGGAGPRRPAGPGAGAARPVGGDKRAAAGSMRSLAYGEAARLCERALRVTGPGGPTGTDRGRLLLARAEALYKAGDVTQAITAAGQAGDEAERRGDPAGMARAALILEGVSDQDWGRRVAHLAESALRQLGHGNAELSARLLAAIVVVRSASLVTGNTGQAGPLSLQSLALAEAAGTPAALVSALRARQMACAGPDGVGDRLEAAERMLALAAEREDPWAALWGRLWRIEASCQPGDGDAAESELHEPAEITHQPSQPVADRHLARTRRAIAIARGRFEHRIRELAAGNPMLKAATEPMLRARASLRRACFT